MKTADILTIVELALSGNNVELVDYVKNIAVNFNNAGKHGLYSGLSKIIAKYEGTSNAGITPSFLQSNNIALRFELPEKVWFPKAVKHKMDGFLDIHASKLSKDSKRKLNKLLLYGPPGTGKTTLGFYIAKKLKSTMNYVRLSDVISPKFGETMKNISDVFQNSNEKIVFIDEFDAFAKKRLDTNDVGELKRIVNSLIQTLDFYSSDKITIVSTNMVDTLDPAILRRFTYKILVDELDKTEREEFLNFLIKNSKDIKIDLTAKDKKFLLDIVSKLGMKTIDQIQQFFDKAYILAGAQRDKDIKVKHFIEGLIITDSINKELVKSLHKKSPEVLSVISEMLEEQGYSKTFISGLLNIHRNTLREYVEKV